MDRHLDGQSGQGRQLGVWTDGYTDGQLDNGQMDHQIEQWEYRLAHTPTPTTVQSDNMLQT